MGRNGTFSAARDDREQTIPGTHSLLLQAACDLGSLLALLHLLENPEFRGRTRDCDRVVDVDPRLVAVNFYGRVPAALLTRSPPRALALITSSRCFRLTPGTGCPAAVSAGL